MNDEKIVFITNFDAVELPHYKACCEAANIRGIFKDDAVDVFGRKMDGCLAFYVPEEQKDAPELDIFHRLYREIANTYKKMLLESGIITQRFADTHWCYLGIEKVYDFANMTYNEFSPLDGPNLSYVNSINGEVPDKSTW